MGVCFAQVISQVVRGHCLNPLSLPFHNRLRHRRDFSLVYRKGLRRSSRHLTLRALQCGGNPEEASLADSAGSDFESLASVSRGSKVGVSRDQRQAARHENQLDRGGKGVRDVTHFPPCFGVSISQKVSKKAVVRNRIKRHLKAAFRQLLPRIGHDWLIVVVVHPAAVQCDYWQFLQELEQMLISAEVIDGYS